MTLAVLPSAAFAESQIAPPRTSAPIAALVGLGVHRQSGGYDTRWRPALVGMVGYRMRPDVAVGLRAGLSRFTYSWADAILDYDDAEEWNVLTVDVAATAQYSASVFTIATSLGRRLSRNRVDGRHCYKGNCTWVHETDWTNDATTLGLSISLGGSHSIPIAVFYDVEVSPFASGRRGYSETTCGLAFRW